MNLVAWMMMDAVSLLDYDLDVTLTILWFDALYAVLGIFAIMIVYWIVKLIISIITGG